MNSNDVIETLSITHEARATLYLNEERVNALFSQQLGAIREVAHSRKLDAKVSASLLKLLGFELAGGQGETVTQTLDKNLKAFLLEHSARESDQLCDLQIDPARQGYMLLYVGDSMIFDVGDPVTESPGGLSQDALANLEAERIRQQNRLQRREPTMGTIVWLATAPRPLASIASEKWVDDGLMGSYGKRTRFGILGRFEQELGGITLISPLWIWFEDW